MRVLLRWVVCMMLVGVLIALNVVAVEAAPWPGSGADGAYTLPGREVLFIYDPLREPTYVPLPEALRARVQQVETPAAITVVYNPSTCGETVPPWPVEAQAAFNYAAGIWQTLLAPSQTIVVYACWRSDLGAGVLGSAGPATFHRDFTGAPMAGTWYPVALANELAGRDLNDSDPEINANFSSDFDWYFGTDGNTGGKVDFATVVLHELGHGLGFVGSMRVILRVGSWGGGTSYPFIYDRFTEDGSGTALLNTAVYPNYSIALGNALTSGAVYFNGPHANAANSGQRVKLYAPSSWQSGSSYSHLDEVFNNTPNALMTYSLAPGEVIHNPGPVTLGMFQDMGWAAEAPNTPPQLADLPDVVVAMDGYADNVMDLWAYASDAEDADENLVFSLTPPPPAEYGVTIDGNRYIDVRPTSGFHGQTVVTVQVADTSGATATDSFILLVNAPPVFTSLPPLFLLSGETGDNAIDLWAYVTDEDADESLVFALPTPPPADFGVTLDGNRYLDVFPAPDFSGVTRVTVQATDTHGASSTASFTLTVDAPPTLDGIPFQPVPVGGDVEHAVDLWAYASDDVDADDQLTFSLLSVAPISVGASIEANRYLDFQPATGFQGTGQVIVAVTDSASLSDTTTVDVLVTADNITPTLDIPDVHLPRDLVGHRLDLLNWAEDRNDGAATLRFTVTRVSDAHIQATVTDTHYVQIVPARGWTGQAEVSLVAEDPGGLTAQDTFIVAVEVWLYLPLVMR